MDFTQFAMGAFVLIGFVNIVQFAIDRDWKSFVKAMTAVVVGGVIGFLKWYGVPSAEIGIALGISSSGIYKVAQKLGGS